MKRQVYLFFTLFAVGILVSCNPATGLNSSSSLSGKASSTTGSVSEPVSQSSQISSENDSSEEQSSISVSSKQSVSSSMGISKSGISSSASISTSVLPTPTTPEEEPVREYYNSKVGMWYCVWWDSEESDPYFYQWHWIKETRIKPAKFGYYATDDIAKLKYDFSYFNQIGIDYLILDDTNNHMADGGNIANHIQTCFETAKDLGAKNAPELCFAGGRPLIDGDLAGMRAEMDVFFAYADGIYKENTFLWKGKPLFVNFNIPKNYGYQDELGRFTMRPAAGHVSEGMAYQYKYGLNKIGMYGWVFNVQYEDSEIYGITPGFSRSHNNLGTSVPPISRENGERYRREWLNALKRKPEMIVISSWNDHAEETGIEAVTLLEPIPGREDEDPYFYQKITQGYLALKTGCLENWYYRSESDDQIYQYKNKKLNKVSEVPGNNVLIIVPDDYFEWAQIPNK